MRSLIAGAGAIGGYIGALMARAGQDVTLYARGPHLRAMQERGLRILSADGDFEVRPRVIGDLNEAGSVDLIFLGVKAHGLTQLAPKLKPLIADNTTVVSTQNGIPWWYFQSVSQETAGEFDVKLAGLQLESVDPGGVIGAAIDPRRVLGSIVYLGTEIVEPGVIRHTEGNRISLGEPDGSRSDRSKAVAEALIKAGLRTPVTARIRNEIWVKLLGNVAFLLARPWSR
jgi:2-dehydropantoate 2-reductase